MQVNFLVLVLIINLTSCAFIEEKIYNKATNTFVSVKFQEHNPFKKNVICIKDQCINYLFFAADTYSDIPLNNKTSIDIEVDNQVVNVNYIAKDEYLNWGAEQQGKVYIFPGFGAAHTTMWLYGTWLSEVGFDVYIFPSSSQMDPFNFGLNLVPFAQLLAKDEKPSLVIGASLGFIAAKRFSLLEDIYKLVGLAPVTDARSSTLANNFINSGWMPWYLSFITEQNIENKINEIKVLNDSEYILDKHILDSNNQLSDALFIRSSNDLIIGEQKKVSSNILNLDYKHEFITSIPFDSARNEILKYYKN